MGFKGEFRQWEHLLRVWDLKAGARHRFHRDAFALKKKNRRLSISSGFFCGCDEPSLGGSAKRHVESNRAIREPCPVGLESILG